MIEPIDVPRNFGWARSTFDIDVVAGYPRRGRRLPTNIPVDLGVGRDNVKATIVGFTAGWERVEFELCNVAVGGPCRAY